MEQALRPGGDGDRPGTPAAATVPASRVGTLGERRAPAERDRPAPSGAPCPTCGTASDRVSGDFDGYIEGYEVCVLECPRCLLRDHTQHTMQLVREPRRFSRDPLNLERVAEARARLTGRVRGVGSA